MKTFTATPAEFQSGDAAYKSARMMLDYQRSLRKPRQLKPKPKPRPSDRMREIGTITPGQFQKGDASSLWRTGKIKPFTAEGIVAELLEDEKAR